ncbi:MAG: hypothetical protein NUW01_14270 [Gemmatimonadaceae bacterium]|nr:hypothetical protein [Gemmatimonadaceae bacterium]
MIDDLHGTTIRIGAIDWTVSIEDMLSNDDLGQMRSGEQSLAVKRNIAPQEKIEVLLHECIHATLRQGGIYKVLGDNLEEGVVEAVAYGLVGLFRDNPDLMRSLIDRVVETTKH